MGAHERVERETSPLDRPYSFLVYEVGSFACCKSDVVANYVVGGVEPTQWRVTSTRADEVDLLWVGREGGQPPMLKRPATFPWAALVATDADALREQQDRVGGEFAIAYRTRGRVLVAGVIHNQEALGGVILLGARYDYDEARPKRGGLELTLGLYDRGSLAFRQTEADTQLLEAKVPVEQFAEGGKFAHIGVQ